MFFQNVKRFSFVFLILQMSHKLYFSLISMSFETKYIFLKPDYVLKPQVGNLKIN